MVMTWTAEADAKLFAAVIKTSEGLKLNYHEIARYMGPDCTAKAVTHRISHIKQIVKTLVPEGETPTTAAAPISSTNGNGTAATAPKTPKTPKKRGSAEANGDGDGSPTPVKKAKTAAKKGKGKKQEEVKVEDAGDGGKVKDEDDDDGGNGDADVDAA